MTEAKRDKNSVTTMIALLKDNGVTVVPLAADSSTHDLEVSNVSTGTDFGPTRARRDNNQVTTLLARSSTGTIVPLYCTSAGSLLIKSV